MKPILEVDAEKLVQLLDNLRGSLESLEQEFQQSKINSYKEMNIIDS